MFDPQLAEIRFGVGLSPRRAPPENLREMLAGLKGPDRMARRYPWPGYSEIEPDFGTLRALVRARGQANTPEAKDAAREALFDVRRLAYHEAEKGLVNTLIRQIRSPESMKERLALFWADHFTAIPRGASYPHLTLAYAEEAIRPNMMGRFTDLLPAAVLHPFMLRYLDQNSSIGPNSRFGQSRDGRGLNENLAREILELHTLGVAGGYSQRDVTQLAELLTGVTFDAAGQFKFFPRRAEPGAEEILGRSYGGAEPARVADIRAALRDIARHPSTGRHLAWKLATHFVADTPDEALVEDMAAVYRATDTDLSATVEAMLRHPAAWVPERRKARPPIGFIGASLRALDVDPATLDTLTPRQIRTQFRRTLSRMGQEWENAAGPDGFPEEAAAWITPQGMAMRINFALRMPERLVEELPDPRAFVETALGRTAPEEVRFAASAAEDRGIGVGLVLASAAFQWR